MEDSRRGFLKRVIAAGTLIVPLGASKPEVVKDTNIITPTTSQAEPVMDLGDCLVIPKSHIKSWSLNVSQGIDYATLCNGVYFTPIISELEISVALQGRVYSGVSSKDKGQIILPYGTLENGTLEK